MRNCFRKITNVFRKKNTQSPPEHGHLAEEEYLRDDVYTRKETKTTHMTAIVSVGAVSKCTKAADNQTSHNNDEGNDINVIEHKKISASSSNHYCDGGAVGDNAALDKQQNAIKKTTPSLATHVSDSQRYYCSLNSYRKKFNKASDPKTQSNEIQVASALILQEYNKEYEEGKFKESVFQAHNRSPNETWESKRQVPLTIRQTTPDESYMAQSNTLGDRGIIKVPAINFIMSSLDRREVLQGGAKGLSADCHSRLSLPTAKGFDGEYKKEVVSVSKTPEDIEYDAKVAAESQDVMTPLPGSAKHHLATGRNAQSEIVEVIGTLNHSVLGINNLTIEENPELMCRFENKYQTRWQSRSNNHIQPGQDELSDSGIDGVVLRRKCPQPFGREAFPSGLYERRQPKSPKLKLVLESIKTEASAAGSVITTTTNLMDSESERNLYDVKCPTILPPNPQLKALLVFHKTDNIYEVMQQACNRQQVEVTLARTRDNALENLCSSTECFHIIIIDARSPKHLDAEHISRSIRHMNGHHFSTIITVVKKR